MLIKRVSATLVVLGLLVAAALAGPVPLQQGEEVPEPGSEEDDTVVVEAASCEQLLQQCKESGDVLSCQTYNEGCQDEEAMGEVAGEELLLCSLVPQQCPKNW